MFVSAIRFAKIELGKFHVDFFKVLHIAIHEYIDTHRCLPLQFSTSIVLRSKRHGRVVVVLVRVCCTTQGGMAIGSMRAENMDNMKSDEEIAQYSRRDRGSVQRFGRKHDLRPFVTFDRSEAAYAKCYDFPQP